MKKTFSRLVEKSRLGAQPPFYPATKEGDHNGIFQIKKDGNIYRVLISDGYGWDHVSISLDKKRCPTWEEMCWIKDLFFDEDEAVVQFHPRKSDYVNMAKTTLHLWRYQGDFPLPDSLMVGF